MVKVSICGKVFNYNPRLKLKVGFGGKNFLSLTHQHSGRRHPRLGPLPPSVLLHLLKEKGTKLISNSILIDVGTYYTCCLSTTLVVAPARVVLATAALPPPPPPAAALLFNLLAATAAVAASAISKPFWKNKMESQLQRLLLVGTNFFSAAL